MKLSSSKRIPLPSRGGFARASSRRQLDWCADWTCLLRTPPTSRRFLACRDACLPDCRLLLGHLSPWASWFCDFDWARDCLSVCSGLRRNVDRLECKRLPFGTISTLVDIRRSVLDRVRFKHWQCYVCENLYRRGIHGPNTGYGSDYPARRSHHCR